MMDELLPFTTDKYGRIRIDIEGDFPKIDAIDQCCCQNNHEPVDGYIYTNAGCKVHAHQAYRPSTDALVSERLEEDRQARAALIQRQILNDRRAVKQERRTIPTTSDRLEFAAFIGTGSVVR